MISELERLVDDLVSLPEVSLDEDGSSVEYWYSGNLESPFVCIGGPVDPNAHPIESSADSIMLTPSAALALLEWLTAQKDILEKVRDAENRRKDGLPTSTQ